MKKIYFVTSNKGKYKEVKEKLEKTGIEIIQHDIGYPEIQVESLEEVVSFGIEFLRKKIDTPFIIEDAGLFIDDLNGFPGVYSAYVYHTIGFKGILELLKKKSNRKAYFKSIYGYSNPKNNEAKIFEGICHGVISSEIRGENGFGYDPIFVPSGESRTFAQMDVKEKNSFSHRGKALDKLNDFLKKSAIENFKV